VFLDLQMGGYETSIASTKFGGTHATRSKKVLRQVMIPSIGKAVQLSNGEIHVSYLDSTKIIVNSSSAEVVFTDILGKNVLFKQDDDIPNHIRSKLAQMPNVFKELMDSG
jgi:polo-like kinase 4